MSLYLYAGANPIGFIDPFGLSKVGWWETCKMIFTEPEVRGAFRSGAGEGVAITANTYTFGATDKIGVTDTTQLNEWYHDGSRIAAEVSRDAALGAVGLGAAKKAADGVRGARGIARAVDGVDAAQDARDVVQASVAAANGDPTALAMMAGGRAVPSGRAADRAVERSNFNAYEVLAEVPIIGKSRSAHRNSASRALANSLRNSDSLRGSFDDILAHNVLGHMQSGAGRNLRNP